MNNKPKGKLGETMVDSAFSSIKDADVVLFLIEATSKDIGKGDQFIIDKLKELGRKTILIINKIDLIKREELLELIDKYKDAYPFLLY